MIERCLICDIKSNETRFYYKSKLCHKCYMKQYRQQHKEQTSIYNREYFLSNREQIYKNAHLRHQNNPELKKSYNRKYYFNHKKEVIKRNDEYQSVRKKLDPIFRMKESIRHSIYMAVTNRTPYSNTKHTSTEKILGCSITYFLTYIEQQFKEGMSWDNYGDWHLDHIVPLCSAHNEKEVYALNHYTNFQPLWAKENLLKGGKKYDK